MDETLVRGLIMGGALALIWWVGTLLWNVLRSSGESARRFKIVVGVGLAATIIWIAVAAHELTLLVGLVVTVGVIVWIARGSRKS